MTSRAVVDLFRLILTFLVVRLANADEETCSVDRKADLGLAEYKAGALNLRTDYDVPSAEECFQRCCTYSDDAGNRCNAVSFYKMAAIYPVCVLLRCDPFSSCVWMPSVNFTAARVQYHVARGAVPSNQPASQIATLNQSARTTSPQGPVVQSTPPGSPVTQDWNVNNGNIPPWMEAPMLTGAPGPDSAVQEVAVDNPAEPFNQPEQPFNQPDQPFNQPDQPINQPDQPFNQPDQPINQPEQAFNQPDQPFNQPDQPINQPEQPFNQPDQPINQPDQPINQPEQNVNQPFDFNDVPVSFDNAGEWPAWDNEETASSPSSPQNQDLMPILGDAEPTRARPFLNQNPGIIIGLCSALGVSFLVLVAICRKIYQAGDKPKYKPLRDYDIRFEPPAASSALLP